MLDFDINSTSEFIPQPSWLAGEHASTGPTGGAGLGKQLPSNILYHPDTGEVSFLESADGHYVNNPYRSFEVYWQAEDSYDSRFVRDFAEAIKLYFSRTHRDYGAAEEYKKLLSAVMENLPHLLTADSQETTDLQDALKDLSGVVEEAKEEGYPEPSRIGMDNANHLLRQMYNYLPIRYEVYPMPKGEVAIEVLDGKGHSVMVMCDRQGGAMCFANLESGHRRVVHEKIDRFFHEFLRGALAEIKERRG